jgi:CDP-2,3-bis-(O-geranylgeranyl)-sn-glycerol synthase
VSSKWVLLPVLGAPLAHAPVLRGDLLPGLKVPVDGGRTWRGRRLFGDNKTWRGALFMTAGPAVAAVALHRVRWYRRRLPPEIAVAPPSVVGALLGLGVFAGELPNSLLKRQLDIAQGGRRGGTAGVVVSVVDQADFAVAALFFLRPIWRWNRREAAEVIAIATAAHLVTNVIGYAIGARRSLL